MIRIQQAGAAAEEVAAAANANRQPRIPEEAPEPLTFRDFQ